MVVVDVGVARVPKLAGAGASVDHARKGSILANPVAIVRALQKSV